MLLKKYDTDAALNIEHSRFHLPQKQSGLQIGLVLLLVHIGILVTNFGLGRWWHVTWTTGKSEQRLRFVFTRR